MHLSELRFAHFTSRGLNLLSTIFGGTEARVILSDRASHPLTVALESRTVVLHPRQTGLFDLALGCWLLRQRPLLKQGPEDSRRKDRWLTRRAQRSLARLAIQELLEKFPAAAHLSGFYSSSQERFDGLRLVGRTVEWEPLTPHPQPPLNNQAPTRPHPPGSGFLELTSIPDLEMTGVDDDFTWLAAAIERGDYPLSTLPGLDDLPYLRLPLRLALGHTFPKIEVWEEQLASQEIKEIVASLVRCHRQKSEVRQDRRRAGKHRHSGVHLDSNRLVEAAVGARVGRLPALFRQKASQIEPVFDPNEHLTVLTFDLQDLRGLSWFDDRSAILRFLAGMIQTYAELEVDFVIQGCAESLIRLSDGTVVCLHVVCPVKAFDETFDELIWARLAMLIEKPPQLPGDSTCFHALAAEEIATAFQTIAREADHSYRTMAWWARRDMHSSYPEFRGFDFSERNADRIDSVMEELERRFDGTFDTLPSFLPDQLKQHGRPKRYLQGVQY